MAADWSELPGWGSDRAAELWPALQRGCARPAEGWAALCAQIHARRPADDAEAALWLMQHLQPYRVESLDGQAEGLLTAYFEPQLDASRRRQGAFQVPLLAPPADLAQRRGVYTRQRIDSDPTLPLRPLAFIEDPIDLLLLQIQGSGRMTVKDAAGRPQLLRLAFAGHNDQPFQSVAKLLIERGELRPGEAGWPALREWARRNPQRLNELLWNNPRYVFFREEPLPDPELGPRGGQGVALTPGRSIAVDKASIPYGTPVWLDSVEPPRERRVAPQDLLDGLSAPGAGPAVPLRRLVMAQDTGSAIIGAVRADYFWGWGPDAETQASRFKQPLRLWALWPRGL